MIEVVETLVALILWPMQSDESNKKQTKISKGDTFGCGLSKICETGDPRLSSY